MIYAGAMAELTLAKSAWRVLHDFCHNFQSIFYLVSIFVQSNTEQDLLFPWFLRATSSSPL